MYSLSPVFLNCQHRNRGDQIAIFKLMLQKWSVLLILGDQREHVQFLVVSHKTITQIWSLKRFLHNANIQKCLSEIPWHKEMQGTLSLFGLCSPNIVTARPVKHCVVWQSIGQYYYDCYLWIFCANVHCRRTFQNTVQWQILREQCSVSWCSSSVKHKIHMKLVAYADKTSWYMFWCSVEAYF
jgi:hypothetical protein